MKKTAIVVALVVTLGAIGAYVATRQANDTNVVRISGNIEITDVEVSFKIPGRVSARVVSEGEAIEAGAAVARLDAIDLEHEVEIRRAELGAVRALLAELEAGFRPEEIAQAEAALARARVEATRAETEYVRQKDLRAKGVISDREYEGAESGYRVSLAQVEEVGQKLALLRRGPRAEHIEHARERVAQAQELLALAETRLGYTMLTSPLSGLVLGEHVEAGEQVVAGTPVVTVGDLATVWLRGYIDETDLGRVKVGQKVRVRSDTYPDRAYEGSVSFIASEAEFTPKSVQTAKERVKLVYRIKVDVPNPALELKPGMPADAEILLAGT